MELSQLKTLIVIAREGNLTRASRQRHLSQSAVSTQLKHLEADLGVTLFERNSRGMKLTGAGRALLPQAEDVLRAAASLKQQALNLSHQEGETITVGLNADPRFLKVGNLNRRLGVLHPELNLIFLTSQTVTSSQMLRRGQIDFGFRYGEMREEDIEQLLLSQVRVCVVVPTRLQVNVDALDWPQVAAMPWVWVANDSPFYRLFLEQLERYQLLPNRAVTATDEQIVRELVADGQGVALMREDEARILVEAGKVEIWPPGWMQVPLCLTWLGAHADENRFKAVREAIVYLWQRGEAQEQGERYWM